MYTTMKRILGLDLGTNSIGWAMIESNIYDDSEPAKLQGRILRLGSRIIPMEGDALSKFESGTPESKAAARRLARGARRLNHRYKLRRTRLIRAFKILGWLSPDFPEDFKKNPNHTIKSYLPYSDDLRREVADYFEITGQLNTQGEQYEIPEDWIIYYLKAKALREQISLTELARVLYHYNQRRGFRSSRKDQIQTESDQESDSVKYPITEKWIEIVHIQDIEDLGPAQGKNKDQNFFRLHCRAGELSFEVIQRRRQAPDWQGKDLELTISRKTTKSGEVSYTVAEVDPADWQNRKEALEKDVNRTSLHLSEYYLQQLRQDRNYRIRERIVDRSFYQKEMDAIWQCQEQYYKDIFADRTNIDAIADAFYVHNRQKNKEIRSRDLYHIFRNDIIYYQRGLKSQKGLLANCRYESRTYLDKDGVQCSAGIKVAPKSHPLFQEFRIWQIIHNLRIHDKEKQAGSRQQNSSNDSGEHLTTEAKERLFELFDQSAELTSDAILQHLGFKKNRLEADGKTYPVRLNYPEDTSFPGNQTKTLFRKVFRKHSFQQQGEVLLADPHRLHQLWHVLYSLPEKKDIESALSNTKYFDFPQPLIKHLASLPAFKSEYAAYSVRALNNLLPLMRAGSYWSEEGLRPKAKGQKGYSLQPAIDLRNRIELFIDSEDGTSISDVARGHVQKENLHSLTDFQGLSVTTACYVAYGRHSEPANEHKYDSVADLRIRELVPYNSMRNPVVEKLVREALNLVRDIWQDPALGRPDYIHVELGRELRKNNKQRQEDSTHNMKNRLERARIEALLRELRCPQANPDSPADQDRFRLWKENGGRQAEEQFESIFKTNKAEFVSNADIEKYKLWAEQGYRSPYTGKPIKLSDLFTEKYQIDHILPRSRFYDDSVGNKVIVEAKINAIKGNRTAIQFIEDMQGRDGEARVLDMETYLKNVDAIFSKKKRRYLKLSEIPEDFVERQLNDTRYLARTVAQFLRPVAKGDETNDGIVYTNGAITTDLKYKWGLHKLWKELVRPRFERLQRLTGEQLIIDSSDKRKDIHFAKDYKRIDHRHQALDGLIVACTTRRHIQYLNSLSSFSNDPADNERYTYWKKWKYLLKKEKELRGETIGMTEFAPPWGTENDGIFFKNVREHLERVAVSYKPSSRLVSPTTNRYWRWKQVDGQWKKVLELQSAPVSDDKYWVAVRQSLFGQPLGRIYLPEYKKNVDLSKAVKAQSEFIRSGNIWKSEDWRIAKTSLRRTISSIIVRYNHDLKAVLTYLRSNPVFDEGTGQVLDKLDMMQFRKYASKRVAIDDSFTVDKIENLPNAHHANNWLPKLLREHLANYDNDPKKAFKGEGLEQLLRLSPFPINKISRKEGGYKIELDNKLLDGDKGVNQYFVIEIVQEENKKTGELQVVRKYSTPPFLEVIPRLAKKLPVHDQNPDAGYIILSPGDTVYVPTADEDVTQIDWTDKKKIVERLYIMKSSNKGQCFFAPAHIARPIIDTKELGSNNKSERPWGNSDKGFDEERMIKACCIKVHIDRLGNVRPVNVLRSNMVDKTEETVDI